MVVLNYIPRFGTLLDLLQTEPLHTFSLNVDDSVFVHCSSDGFTRIPVSGGRFGVGRSLGHGYTPHLFLPWTRVYFARRLGP